VFNNLKSRFPDLHYFQDDWLLGVIMGLQIDNKRNNARKDGFKISSFSADDTLQPTTTSKTPSEKLLEKPPKRSSEMKRDSGNSASTAITRITTSTEDNPVTQQTMSKNYESRNLSPDVVEVDYESTTTVDSMVGGSDNEDIHDTEMFGIARSYPMSVTPQSIAGEEDIAADELASSHPSITSVVDTDSGTDNNNNTEDYNVMVPTPPTTWTARRNKRRFLETEEALIVNNKRTKRTTRKAREMQKDDDVQNVAQEALVLSNSVAATRIATAAKYATELETLMEKDGENVTESKEAPKDKKNVNNPKAVMRVKVKVTISL
jgi:DNA uptake protein ComE-like DNA-binding protein